MPDNDTSGVHVWFVMMKTYQALQKHAERTINATDLCFSDFVALEVLLHKGKAMPVSTLGEKLLLTSGSLTATVDRLEKKGYVERVSGHADRRVRLVQLTEQGNEVAQNLFSQHKQDMENVVACFSTAERKTLVGLLKHLAHNAAVS